MTAVKSKLDRPIRVVMFGSGPVLNPDATEFLCRLETHPDIELLGAFCQAEARSIWAVFKDLWQRRSLLAFPLFVAWVLGRLWRFVLHPHAVMEQRRQLELMELRIHFVPNVHASDVLDQVASLKPDLGLIYGSPILKPKLFEIPALGTLGIHHGKVPQYRGNKTTFWAVYNAEKVAGVTIQKINAGLDTGQIVKEGEVSIGHRSLGSVLYELEELGLDLYIQAIIEVKEGIATYRPQSGRKGRLYRNPKFNDLLGFWVKQTKRRFSGI